jgi:dTDP-glucose 4,6-dehydratase
MQNILVTGGCGFIGTNFIRLLFDDADFRGRVINVDKLTYAGNPESLADVDKAVIFLSWPIFVTRKP